MPWNKIVSPAGIEPLQDPAVVRDAAAGVDVFIGQRDGVLYTPGSPLGRWTEWGLTSSPTPTPEPGDLGAARVAAGHESDDRIVLFVADDDVNSPSFTVWHMSQTKAGALQTQGGWSQWKPIGDSFGMQGTQLGQPAVAYGSSGELYVFIAVSNPNDLTNSLFYSVETKAGSGNWSGWKSLGGGVPPAYRPIAVSNIDGGLDVFVRTSSGAVDHISQASAGGSWSSWSSLGTPGPGAAGNVAAASNDVQAGTRSGCLEVLVVGSDSNLYQISQVTPGGTWTAWTNLGGVGQRMILSGYPGAPFASPPIGHNSDGRLEAYAVAADNAVHRIPQQSPGGSWSGWASLGSPGPALASNPAVGVLLDNDLLQLFVVGADGNLYQISQRRTSNW
jgi:hypothetical protein